VNDEAMKFKANDHTIIFDISPDVIHLYPKIIL